MSATLSLLLERLRLTPLMSILTPLNAVCDLRRGKAASVSKDWPELVRGAVVEAVNPPDWLALAASSRAWHSVVREAFSACSIVEQRDLHCLWFRCRWHHDENGRTCWFDTDDLFSNGLDYGA